MFQNLHAKVVQHAPECLSVPLRYTPFTIKKQAIEQLIRWQFKESLEEGDLDFLVHHWLKIEVSDLGLTWFITLKDNKLIVSENEAADVIFRANANDLVLIAARKEDPDTLFFQRRLMVEGDTELGLYVKNLMDSIELDNMPPLLRKILLQLADFIQSGQDD